MALPKSNPSLLQSGRLIPAGESCPFSHACPEAKHCNRPKNMGASFSCGAARAFDRIQMTGTLKGITQFQTVEGDALPSSCPPKHAALQELLELPVPEEAYIVGVFGPHGAASRKPK